MASRTLFSERLGFVLHVGAFVHVREDKVPDRGKLKVYQLTKFWPETDEFEGSYWEQPRLDGSSLREHDFDGGDHPVVKLLPEIVHTPEIRLMDIRIIDPLPVFHIHSETIVKMDVTPVGIKGAYVFGRKIMKSVRGKWFSKPVDSRFRPPFWVRTAAEVKLGIIPRTEHMWETYRLLGDTIQTVLQRATPGEWSDSELVRGFDDRRWHYLVNAHPAEPSSHIKGGTAVKKLRIGGDLTFLKRAVQEEVQSLVFRSAPELNALTSVLGRFWNIAPYRTQVPDTDQFSPHMHMNFKAIHPLISTADVAFITRIPDEYRRKKRKEGGGGGGGGAATLGTKCRAPGVYLTYTKEAGHGCGSLSVAVSWHDKVWQGRGWKEEVVARLIV
jgi:hypothetical protein